MEEPDGEIGTNVGLLVLLLLFNDSIDSGDMDGVKTKLFPLLLFVT